MTTTPPDHVTADAEQQQWGSGPDPAPADVALAWWRLEADATDHYAEIRALAEEQARQAKIENGKAIERARRTVEALKAQRKAEQPPPPVAPAPQPQRLDVHHHGLEQPAPKDTSRAFVLERLLGLVALFAFVGSVFLLLVVIAATGNGSQTMTDKARSEIQRNRWTCDDVADVEALTVNNDGILYFWITPVGECP